MASNLSTIGFVFPDQDAFQGAMLKCAGEAQGRLACANGEYGIWHSPSGAQVWFHLGPASNGEVEIYGLSPFFEGKSEVSILVSRPVHRTGENPFEGAFQGWVNPDGNGGGAYPIVFDAVDFSTRKSEAFPAVHQVRLAAFARDLTAFADEAAFFAAQEQAGGVKVATEAFIPMGMFLAAQEANSEPQAATAEPASTALFTGTVGDHCQLRNEASGREFHWLMVKTLDGVQFDVIADPAIVKGDIAPGAIVEVSALLFGRFLD